MSIIRTRWAAIGAAVAVALGAGGIGLVSATNPSDAVAFVPITPCRVMDTRPEFNVGPKASPLGPREAHTINTTTGDTGNCTGIPTTATAVSLNITALDATLPTFLTVWATGEPQPEASSLNPVPGAPPTPNAVTTAINTGGQFNVYNLQGNVQILADINGYYVNHNHDDRYYTKAQSDSRYLDAPISEIEVNLYGAQPLPGSTGWTVEYNWRHTTTTNECLIAPISIPVGRTIAGVEIVYFAAGPVSVTPQVIGYRNTPGPDSDVVHILGSDAVALGAAPTEFVAATREFTGDRVARADTNYSAAFCTSSPLYVSGFRVLLG